MDCASVYCDIDDYCQILKEERPKARKEHKCHECERLIVKGEQYLAETTLYDGSVETWKTCCDCESIREAFYRDGFYWGDTIWMLRDHIRDCWGEISETTISNLTPGAQEKVCAMIESAWEDIDDD